MNLGGQLGQLALEFTRHSRQDGGVKPHPNRLDIGEHGSERQFDLVVEFLQALLDHFRVKQRRELARGFRRLAKRGRQFSPQPPQHHIIKSVA